MLELGGERRALRRDRGQALSINLDDPNRDWRKEGSRRDQNENEVVVDRAVSWWS